MNVKLKKIKWMRQAMLLSVFVFMSCEITAQEPPIQRTIEITGSAEMDVQPDQIELSITTRSDANDDKQKELMKILEKNGIDANKVNFESSNTYNWWWYYSSYRDQSIQRYTVSVDSTVNSIELMEDLKKPWIQQVYVSNKSNSKIQDYREEVKIEAIRAARKKAIYLLAALDEEIGSVLTITEVNNDQNNNRPYYYYWNQNTNNTLSNSVVSSGQSGSSTVDGVSMQKLRYEVKVVFTIKDK
ncbi:SIMPL domain-containing protein [Paracrocinitomix mangrovi]|uniref:SIMPL domain-containing protein n=1 Tax=Paracrocinitomix mangrovi TaxID=2862509 RepID=UPI001C8E309B|nr:SIMPL domain-containing protein [Paracrocinitomix mangrovi]UKN00259.1 SIMPL domain-containing protein [Paracrocinitomix mangrovi]